MKGKQVPESSSSVTDSLRAGNRVVAFGIAAVVVILLAAAVFLFAEPVNTLRVAVLAALGVPKAAAEVLVLGAKVAVDPQEHLEITPEVEDQEDLQ